MEIEIASYKENLSKSQVSNDNLVKSLREKITELSTQLSKKEEVYVKDKDQVMQELVSH